MQPIVDRPGKMKPYFPQGFDHHFPGLYQADPRGLYIVEDMLSPKELEAMRAEIRRIPETHMGWSLTDREERDFTAILLS